MIRKMDVVRACCLPLLLGVACASAAGVGNHTPQQLSISGFGTLGYVASDDNSAHFVRDLSQSTHGMPEDSLLPDSRLGLQMSYRISSQVEAVAQVVARDQEDISLGRSLEWAFIAFHPTPDIDLRLGRLGFDCFMLSDYRSVGYAYTWVRPVSEFYSWIPVYNFDGMDASYAWDTDVGRWRMKVLGGQGSTRNPVKEAEDTYKSDFDPIWGVVLSNEYGAWRAKLSHVELRFDSSYSRSSAELKNGLQLIASNPMLPAPFAAEAQTLLSEMTVVGEWVKYNAAGVSYDDNIWLAQAEYSQLSSDAAIIPQGDRAYVSLGRRFGSLTPYVVQAWARPSDPAAAAQNNWGMMGADMAMMQAGAVYAVNSARIDQSTTSLGMRWDFANTAALKLQWDHTQVEDTGWGLWFRPNQAEADTVNLFTATVDWVF